MAHPNEVKVTEDIRDALLDMASKLSPRHVEALEEQIKRQSSK